MRYTITAPITGFVSPGGIAAQAYTAREALAVAEELAKGDRHGITITSADGASFDLDQFRELVQTSGSDEAGRSSEGALTNR
jgi:hypothetical protein